MSRYAGEFVGGNNTESIVVARLSHAFRGVQQPDLTADTSLITTCVGLWLGDVVFTRSTGIARVAGVRLPSAHYTFLGETLYKLT